MGLTGKPNQPEFQEEIMEGVEGGYFGYCLRRWLIPKRCHYKISCQEMGINMLCLLMCSIIFWKTRVSFWIRSPLDQKWKTGLWIPMQHVSKTVEEKGRKSHFVVGSRYCWMRKVANSLSLYRLLTGGKWWEYYGSRGKSVWTAALWQDITEKAEDLPVKVHHHIHKSQANKDCQNHKQVNQAARQDDIMKSKWQAVKHIWSCFEKGHAWVSRIKDIFRKDILQPWQDTCQLSRESIIKSIKNSAVLKQRVRKTLLTETAWTIPLK